MVEQTGLNVYIPYKIYRGPALLWTAVILFVIVKIFAGIAAGFYARKNKITVKVSNILAPLF